MTRAPLSARSDADIADMIAGTLDLCHRHGPESYGGVFGSDLRELLAIQQARQEARTRTSPRTETPRSPEPVTVAAARDQLRALGDAVRSADELRDEVHTVRERCCSAGRNPTAAERRQVAELEATLGARQREAGPTHDPWTAALHEAGHAVAYTVRGRTVTAVTLTQCDVREGVDDAVAAAAGAAAAHLGGCAGGLSPGDERALEGALAARGRGRIWRAAAYRQARDLLAAHWPAVEGVARALVCRGRLSGGDAREVMRRSAVGARRAAENRAAVERATSRRFVRGVA